MSFWALCELWEPRMSPKILALFVLTYFFKLKDPNHRSDFQRLNQNENFQSISKFTEFLRMWYNLIGSVGGLTHGFCNWRGSRRICSTLKVPREPAELALGVRSSSVAHGLNFPHLLLPEKVASCQWGCFWLQPNSRWLEQYREFVTYLLIELKAYMQGCL